MDAANSIALTDWLPSNHTLLSLQKDRGSGGETLMRVSLNSNCLDSQALEYLAEPGHVIN